MNKDPLFATIGRAMFLSGLSEDAILTAVACGKVDTYKHKNRTYYSMTDLKKLGERRKPRALTVDERLREIFEEVA